MEPESYLKASRMNGKAFVSLGHAVYELVPQIDLKGRADYQLEKWQELSRYHSCVGSSNILLTFDKVKVSLQY